MGDGVLYKIEPTCKVKVEHSTPHEHGQYACTALILQDQPRIMREASSRYLLPFNVTISMSHFLESLRLD